jgi:hypothetical protein
MAKYFKIEKNTNPYCHKIKSPIYEKSFFSMANLGRIFLGFG